jgi:hypothetical protein
MTLFNSRLFQSDLQMSEISISDIPHLIVTAEAFFPLWKAVDLYAADELPQRPLGFNLKIENIYPILSRGHSLSPADLLNSLILLKVQPTEHFPDYDYAHWNSSGHKSYRAFGRSWS